MPFGHWSKICLLSLSGTDPQEVLSEVSKQPDGSCPFICPAVISGNQFVRTSTKRWEANQ